MKLMFWKKDPVDEAAKAATRDSWYRFFMLLVGCFCGALAFNIFFLPRNIVIGNISGLSIIFKQLYGWDTTIFILISSAILVVVSYFALGKKSTINDLIGTALFDVMIILTQDFGSYLQINIDNIMLVVLFGGLLSGVSNGLIYRSGYSSGGTDIPEEMLFRFLHFSRGKANFMVDGSILILGGFFSGTPGVIFAWEQVMYAIIILYLSSIVTDKVMLGISESKCFYIVTTHETSVKRYLMTYLKHGVTVLDGRGGFTGDHKKVIMCIIPTKEYFLVKEGIHNIDADAFFLVTDAYEVYGGE